MEKRNKLFILLLIGLVLVGYINSLGNSFVSDDRGILINAQSWDLSSVFSRPFTFLRPLLYLVTYKIAGFTPFLFRISNIAFHLGATLLIFYIVGKLANKKVAIVSAALFAAHPLLVESVTWISGGVYAQYSFFFLLSFWLYILSPKNKKNYIFSLVAYVCALLSNEKAIPLALTFVVYELSFGNLKKYWLKTSPYFILSTLWVMFYFLNFADRVSYLENQGIDLAPYNPFFQIPIAISSYLQLIFWPSGLTIYHSEMIFTPLEFFIRVIVLLGLLGLIFYSLKRNKFIFFWLSFFIIALLATINPLVHAWVVAERYAYLASLGIFVSVAWVMVRLFKNRRQEKIAVALFAIVIAMLLVRTGIRNMDWRSEDTLWPATAKTSPSSAQNHNNLGDYYGRHGDMENSIREFKKAIELKPNYAEAYHNLGNAYRDRGQINNAILSYKKALSITPSIWQSYQNIAGIYYGQGKYSQALEFLQKGLALDKKNINLLFSEGIVYSKIGDKNRAGNSFHKILTIDPNNQLAKQALLQLQNGTSQ